MSIFETALPEGWAWEPLGRHYRITKKPRALSYAELERIPFAPMEAVSAGGSASIRYEMRPAHGITSGTYFERGDVLVARITPSFENGKQGKADDLPHEFGVASTELIPLQPIGDAERWYLFFYLLHPEVRNCLTGKMEGSTARQRVPDRALLELMMPMPPPKEQAAIAAVLRLLQRARGVEEQHIATTRELKQAAMQQLFTRGLRGEELKETEIGPMPKSWGLVPLAEIRQFLQYGTSKKCQYSPTGVPVLRIPNVADGRIEARDLKWAEVSTAEEESLGLRVGDLLFIRTNGVRDRVGATAVYQGTPPRALFASYLIRARLDLARMLPAFLQYFTTTEAGRSQLEGRASPAADGKFNVNTKMIDAVMVPMPTLGEQGDLVQALKAIDANFDLHQQKSAALSELFTTLLHDLMTGQICVTDGKTAPEHHEAAT